MTLDPVAETAAIVPVRGAAFKANVTQFLQPPQGMAGWVSFRNLDFSDFYTEGIVRLQVAVTHPFPGMDEYRGFDVLGVFMGGGTWESDLDPLGFLPRPDGSEDRLLNADGYTRWFNPTEFTSENIFGFVPGIFGTPGFRPTATINGYKYFADNLGPSDDAVQFFRNPVNIENRGSFTPGSVNSRDYEVQFADPTGGLEYQYAIEASWDKPSDSGHVDLGDFALTCNQKEPFLEDVDTTESTLYYEDADNKGGTLIMHIEVFDWQALSGEGGDVPIPDGVSAIWVESFSSLIPAPVDVLAGATVSAGGPVSSVFSVEILSADPIQAGDEPLLVKVESAPPESYDQGFGAPASHADLGAYELIYVAIETESPFNQAPSVGDITGETEPLEIEIEDYHVDALDPEGDPLHYEWSLVDDGLAADWGNVGEDADTITINWSDHGFGEYDLHCRVKDDYNDWQLAANNPLDIAVEELTITCGSGAYDYFVDHWSDNDGVEPVFLSDGTVIIQYTLAALNWNWFNNMKIMYETDIGGYCSYIGDYDPCEDDWCRDWSHLYDVDNDGTNVVVHMDCDPNDTWGPGQETDDVVAFVLLNQPNIVRFIGNINNSSQTPASNIANKTIPTGINVLAIDFDEDGDLWVLEDGGNVYELTKSSTYDVGSALFAVDMSTVAPGSTKVFDWAMSYLTGDLYVFTDETTGGTIHRISGSTGAILDTVANALDAGNTNPPYGLGSMRGDIEIDHRVFDGENPLAEHCRLVVSGGIGSGQAGMFARYDQGLNLLSTWDNNGPGGGSCNNDPSDYGARYIMFDPIDHVDDPSEPGDEEAWDHAMWVGGAGTFPANTVWGTGCRPAPEDWDGW